jgi:hypothetical protein
MSGNSWDHAARKVREETHCVSVVRADEALGGTLTSLLVFTPEGQLLFSGVATEEHVVQFVIEAVGVAWMEINQ